ncbi:hypothetical protein BC830DRAFT_1158937 [Chytriomyces sp. MP71]|nr:hypothetical protein BC830DRAFT_1158937 [Chytriomyces sp. MP71]
MGLMNTVFKAIVLYCLAGWVFRLSFGVVGFLLQLAFVAFVAKALLHSDASSRLGDWKDAIRTKCAKRGGIRLELDDKDVKEGLHRLSQMDGVRDWANTLSSLAAANGIKVNLGGFQLGGESSASSASPARVVTPNVIASTVDNDIILDFELAGFSRKDVDLLFHDNKNSLTLRSNETSAVKDKRVDFEYKLNEVVEPGSIRAKMENGVLRVTVTKKSFEGRRIAVDSPILGSDDIVALD